MITPELIIYSFVFITVIVMIIGVYLVAFGRTLSTNSRVNRRMELIEKNGSREEVLNQLRKEMGQHLKAQNIPIYSLLAEKAQRANVNFTPTQLIMMMAMIALVVFMALSIATSTSLPIRLVAGIAAGVGAVYLWIQGAANKRMAAIEEQLPDAVELMVRSLRVGHPLSNALNVVASEVADPLGSEIGFVADESAYGRDIGEALKDMANRLDMQDLRFLAVAVLIQQQSGGNLAEVLDGLSKVIRARFKLFRRVKAITAEAQWSGKFLSGFPILMIIAINLIKPDYYDNVIDTPVFVPGCLIVAALLIANMVVMRKLVNIKV